VKQSATLPMSFIDHLICRSIENGLQNPHFRRAAQNRNLRQTNHRRTVAPDDARWRSGQLKDTMTSEKQIFVDVLWRRERRFNFDADMLADAACVFEHVPCTILGGGKVRNMKHPRSCHENAGFSVH
jgi:hypothetical protein